MKLLTVRHVGADSNKSFYNGSPFNKVQGLHQRKIIPRDSSYTVETPVPASVWLSENEYTGPIVITLSKLAELLAAVRKTFYCNSMYGYNPSLEEATYILPDRLAKCPHGFKNIYKHISNFPDTNHHHGEWEICVQVDVEHPEDEGYIHNYTLCMKHIVDHLYTIEIM